MREVERYARTWATAIDGYEVSLGVEYNERDNVADMATQLHDVAKDALLFVGFKKIADFAEAVIKQMWPNRAYFVEVDDGKCGVQIYAPYGVPKWK